MPPHLLLCRGRLQRQSGGGLLAGQRACCSVQLCRRGQQRSCTALACASARPTWLVAAAWCRCCCAAPTVTRFLSIPAAVCAPGPGVLPSCCSARQQRSNSRQLMVPLASSRKQRRSAAVSAPLSARPAARASTSGTSSRRQCSPTPSCRVGQAGAWRSELCGFPAGQTATGMHPCDRPHQPEGPLGSAAPPRCTQGKLPARRRLAPRPRRRAESWRCLLLLPLQRSTQWS